MDGICFPTRFLAFPCQKRTGDPLCGFRQRRAGFRRIARVPCLPLSGEVARRAGGVVNYRNQAGARSVFSGLSMLPALAASSNPFSRETGRAYSTREQRKKHPYSITKMPGAGDGIRTRVLMITNHLLHLTELRQHDRRLWPTFSSQAAHVLYAFSIEVPDSLHCVRGGGA